MQNEPEKNDTGRSGSIRDKEEAAHDSDLLFWEAINNANDSIFLVERTPVGPGKYLLVNDKAVQMLGYSKEEFMKMSPRDIVPEEIAKIIMPDVLKKLLKHGEATFESENRKKDGSIYPVEVSVRAFHYKGRDVDLSIVRDITERKRVEDSLKKEKQRLANIIEGTRAGTWEWNVQTGETIFNEQWAEMIGYTLSEISPISIKTWMYYAHPDDLQRSGELLERHFLKKSEWYECEIRMKHKNGDWVWVMDRGKVASWTKDGKPLWMFGTHQDITERKVGEEAIKEQNEKIRLLLDTTAEAIYGLDINGNCTFCNKSCLRMLGFKDSNELIGKNMHWLIHAKHPDGTHFPFEECDIFQSFKNGEELHSDNIVFWRSDSTSFPAECWSFPQLRDGEVVGTVVTFLDISDRTKAEKDLHHLTQELENRILQRTEELEQEIMHRKTAEAAISASLNEKEILLREIHHRVKNNLQIITSLIRLQKQQITDPTTQDVLHDSENRIRSMALIHEKLYRSKDLTSIDFTDYIRTLSSGLINSYAADPHRIRLVIDIKDLSLDINTAIPMGLIMNELVANALKHAFPDDRRGEVTITGRNTPAGIFLSVQDNGVGLPEGMDWRNTSTLGLHLVITLIKQVKGSVELNSTGGTAFEMLIPSANEAIS